MARQLRHRYAGYAPKPDWLTCDRLWWRAGQKKGDDPKADYRRYLEDYLRQGVAEGAFERLTAALAMGGGAFVKRLRRKVPKGAGGETNARSWRRLLPFTAVVKALESVKGERWEEIVNNQQTTNERPNEFIIYAMCLQEIKLLGL